MEAITKLHSELQGANSEYEQLLRQSKLLDEELKQACLVEESVKSEHEGVSRRILEGKHQLQEENITLDNTLQELHSIEVENSCLKTELDGLTALITKCALNDVEEETNKIVASVTLLSKSITNSSDTKLKIRSIQDKIEKYRENAKVHRAKEVNRAEKEAEELQVEFENLDEAYAIAQAMSESISKQCVDMREKISAQKGSRDYGNKKLKYNHNDSQSSTASHGYFPSHLSVANGHRANATTEDLMSSSHVEAQEPRIGVESGMVFEEVSHITTTRTIHTTSANINTSIEHNMNDKIGYPFTNHSTKRHNNEHNAPSNSDINIVPWYRSLKKRTYEPYYSKPNEEYKETASIQEILPEKSENDLFYDID